ncbi:MAG TPA: hypothetical protein VLQ45_27235 [Thermoanaerobaculia bacterium]|nr:hypothetical protein [Thermoanaerobaculia bacterium]
MKKKFKKLSLTTETLRNLNGEDLKEVAGAVSETNCTANCSLCTGTCSLCTKNCSVCCM